MITARILTENHLYVEKYKEWNGRLPRKGEMPEVGRRK
jgi:hypothetical protein